VYVYDLLRNVDVIQPVLVVDAGSQVNSPTFALAFNKKQSQLLATGDSAGVKVSLLSQD
jgi:hypothetical protein